MFKISSLTSYSRVAYNYQRGQFFHYFYGYFAGFETVSSPSPPWPHWSKTPMFRHGNNGNKELT